MPDFAPEPRLIEALSKVPFVAVIDLFPGPLTDLATIAAPGAAFAEKEGTYTNGRGTTQRLFFARPTPGQARPEIDLLHALVSRARPGRKSGYALAEIFAEMAAAIESFRGLCWEGLLPKSPPAWSPHMAAKGSIVRHSARPFEPGLVPLQDRLPGPSAEVIVR
jgi:predicted molibdopterin-dependent oxidoreductase YjgC